MFRKRISTPILAFGLLFLALGCQDTADPVVPVEPQMAKPVKPPPDAEPSEPEIQEFWVYDKPTEAHPYQQCIHFVASGSFIGMGVSVAHDYFFNGYQDLYDHYEYDFIGGPPRADTEFRDDPELGTLGYEEVCFNGEYDSSEEPFKFFPDYLTTSIGGDGPDPIALVPAVTTDVTKYTQEFRIFRPKGVIWGGETYDPDELPYVTSIWNNQTYNNPTFYATWKGEPASGNYFVQDLYISDPTCTLEYGKGKNKNEVLGTTISLTASFEYGVRPALTSTASYWSEGHILVRPAGSEAGPPSQISGRKTIMSQNGTGTLSWTFDGYLGEALDVEFAVDYLFLSGSEEAYSYVYDPGQNGVGVLTTAGFADDLENAWNPTTNLSTTINDGKFPVAHSGFLAVTCH